MTSFAGGRSPVPRMSHKPNQPFAGALSATEVSNCLGNLNPPAWTSFLATRRLEELLRNQSTAQQVWQSRTKIERLHHQLPISNRARLLPVHSMHRRPSMMCAVKCAR